jgi:hypothetical protein
MASTDLHSLPRVIALGFAALVAACGGAPVSSGSGGNGGTVGTGATGATGAPGAAASSTSGGGTATQAPDGPASVEEPCTLLTAAEIKEATGFDVRWTFPNEDVPGDLPVGCNWSLGTSESGADIVIGVRSPGGAALFDPSRGSALDGIGDRAVQTEPAVVEAVKGDTFVSITYLASEDRPDISRELARMIMSKV